MISKALIIADPWIGYILKGEKTWEMRSQATGFRGWFGLIRKGTGAVWGVARLIEVGAPLAPAEMLANVARHRIPEAMIRSGAVGKWIVPWKLADARALATPVPYRHRSGAVTWVDLEPEVAVAIDRQLAGTTAAAPIAESKPRNAADTRPAAPILGNATLIGVSELTDGNIRNNHFYMRRFIDKFPDDAIGGSNRNLAARRTVTVDWGGAEPQVTDIDGEKQFFRSRGWTKRFFELNDALPGDRVLVEETAPYRYRVRIEKASGTPA